MKEKLDQQAYWNSRAASWAHHQEPLIPSAQELEFIRKHLVEGGDTLILGVTPQLCKLALEVSGSVTAVDFAKEVIETLRLDGVTYVHQNWLDFLEENDTQYDNILTDGGLNCLEFPHDWSHISRLVQSRLKPGGVFSPRVYLSTENPPKAHYANPSLERFVSGIARVNENWMMQATNHSDYDQFDVWYAFPPKGIVLQTFNELTLIDELTPSYEEGERFVSFALKSQ